MRLRLSAVVLQFFVSKQEITMLLLRHALLTIHGKQFFHFLVDALAMDEAHTLLLYVQEVNVVNVRLAKAEPVSASRVLSLKMRLLCPSTSAQAPIQQIE
jgi:hypothetical protein